MPRFSFFLDDRSPRTEVLNISKDATLPLVEIQLFDGFDAVVLDNPSATFSMDDETGTNKVSDAAAVIDDGGCAKVSYQLAAADTDTVGRFFGQFKITSGGETYLIPDNKSQRLMIEIGEKVN